MAKQVSKLRKISSIATKLFYIFILLHALLSLHLSILSALLQLVFCTFLITLRLKKHISVFFLPTELVLSLPYFWALNVILQTNSLNQIQIFAFLLAFSLSLLDNLQLASELSITSSKSTLKYGIWCSIVFYFMMSATLRDIFPTFSIELYKASVINGILFFGGFPICISAFYEYCNADSN